MPDNTIKTAKTIKNPVHKFELGGDYFVVDPNSGAVHIADKQAFDLLDKVKPSIFDRYEGIEGGCYKELYDLYKSGLLFSEDDCQSYADSDSYANTPLKALCLHVSHDCNLRCKYCFASELVCSSDKSPTMPLMPIETAKSAIDFLVANSGERTELEADFFGGEPLMAWETVTAAVDYARANEEKWGKNFRFTITTNGILLDDEKIDYINREMSNCVLSLDGRKSVNDAMRPTVNGKGSFDVIVPKFQKLLETRTKPNFTDCYIRGTFTASNLDFSEDLIEMSRLGFKNCSLEPVTASPDSPYAIKYVHIEKIYEQYEKIYYLMKSGELDVNFFHFNVDLNGGPCVIRRLRGCGCGVEYLSVTPNGDIYPCHRFASFPEQKLGFIKLGSPGTETLDSAKIQEFAKTHIYSKSDCPACWARFYCSGGCNASSYENHGNIKTTDSNSIECLMMKKRLECAIAINALKLSN